MINKILIFSLLVFISLQCETVKYDIPPIATSKIVIDEYFGQRIKDPYRYMENLNDSTFINWLRLQNNYSEKTLNNISNKDVLRKQIEKHDRKTPFHISSIKMSDDNTYFYLKRNTNESINKLYVRKGFNGEEKLLFSSKSYKPETLDSYTINYFQPSWDASKIVIGLSKNDEEFSVLIIYDLQTNQLLPDNVGHIWPNALGGIEWLPDNSGFIYTYIPVINSKEKGYLFNTKAVLYKIGQKNQLRDIFSKENNPSFPINEEDFPMCYYPDSKSKFILVQIGGVAIYRDTYYTTLKELSKVKPRWKLLFSRNDKINQFYIRENDLFFKTSRNAPNFRICKTSLLNPNFINPEVLVEEDSVSVITDYTISKNGLYYAKVKNGINAKLYLLQNGFEEELKLPKPSGYVSVRSQNPYSDNVWIEIEGWTNETERYRYELKSNGFIEENVNPVESYDELKDIVIEEVEVYSHDSVNVPLSIVYKKGIRKNSSSPVLIYGYGAYKQSITPYPYSYLIHWLNNDGIFAIAHVRGGGEKGDTWHKGGLKTTKSNTWKDFIECTEYLVDNNYTTKKKITAIGASAGGICVGRAITDRPDLYAAAIIKVGNFNTIRAENAPNGKNNTKEFGTVKDSVEFKALLDMDSYHHITGGEIYPAVLLTTGTNDARVPAWQAAKFAARLQAANTSQKPILLSVDFSGGHGVEVVKEKQNKETANIISFALWQTGHPDYQPK